MLKNFLKYIFCMIVAFNGLDVFASCLKEGDKIRLSGIVSEKLYYGPPGWGEDKKHDAKLYEWILHLNKSLTCVEGADTDKSGWNHDIQLIMRDNNDYKTKKNLLGRNVSIDGVVFLAETGYHITSVLLDNAMFATSDK